MAKQEETKSKKKTSFLQLVLAVLVASAIIFIIFCKDRIASFKQIPSQSPLPLPIAQKLLKKAEKAEKEVEVAFESDMKQEIKEDVYEQEKLRREVDTLSARLVEARKEIEVLKAKIEYRKINEQQLKIVYALIDMQSKIDKGEVFKTELDQLKMLANKNKFILEKAQTLTPYSMKRLVGTEEVQLIFEDELNTLLKARSQKMKNNGFLEKAKIFFARLVTIRKVDNKYMAFEADSVDLWLSRIEKMIEEKKYSQALLEIDANSGYASYLNGTKKALQDIVTVNEAMQDLMDYIKISTKAN